MGFSRSPPKSVIKSLADIRKVFKSIIEDISEDKPISSISTGSIIIDALVGERVSGFPRSRITEICGAEASCKTTLALHACIEAQKKNEKIVYLDFERTFDRFYAADCGLNTKDPNFMLMNPDHFEQGTEVASALAKTGEVGLIVLDSVAAMTPKAEREGGGHALGLHARLLSQWLGGFAKDLADTKTACVAVNQLRTKIPKPGERPEEYSSGGKALQFYDSIKIKLVKCGSEKSWYTDPKTGVEKEEVMSIKVRATVAKNKLSRPFRQGEFWVRLGKGIDNVASILEIAKAKKIITSGGPYFTMHFECDGKAPGEFRVKGSEELVRFVTSRLDVQQSILKAMGTTGAFAMSEEEQAEVLNSEATLAASDEPGESLETEEVVHG